jgi:hypothetical protein
MIIGITNNNRTQTYQIIMTPNFEEILLELSYRVDSGIPDLTNKYHIEHLIDILRENGIPNATELAKTAQIHFSQLNEKKTTVKNRESGNIYTVASVDPSIHDTVSDDEKSKQQS